MSFIRLKHFLTYSIIASCVMSYSQSNEDNAQLYLNKLYEQRIVLCDSLINEGLYGPARNVLKDPLLYTYFIDKKEVFSRKNRIIDSLSADQSSDENYREYMYLASQAALEGNHEAAIGWYKKCLIHRFFKEEAQGEIDKINKAIRVDTIYSKFGYGLPSQLGYLPITMFQGAQRLPPTDTSKLYLLKDTSLFSGVLVYKSSNYKRWQNTYQGYKLTYYDYSDGIKNGIWNEEYHLPANIQKRVNLNRYYIPEEFEHYLFSKNYTKEDTIYSYNYHSNGKLSFHTKSFYTQEYSMRNSKSYDFYGNLIYSLESERKNGNSKHFEFEFNEKRDTLYHNIWHFSDSINHSFKLRLNADLDTLEYYLIENNLKIGIEYKLIESGDHFHTLGILWNKGTINDIIGTNLIFVSEKGELLKKETFIQEANDVDKNLWKVLLENHLGDENRYKYLILYLVDSDEFKNSTDGSTKDANRIIRNKEKIIEKWLKNKKI